MRPDVLLRALAILIAVVGVIDPAFTADRTLRPVIALVDSPGTATDFADDVARDLSTRYRVARGLSADAAATVVVGDRLPRLAEAIGKPAFVVTPPSVAGAPSIARIDAPVTARFDSRVPVPVSVAVQGARGQTLVVSLETDGVAIDRVERPIEQDTAIVDARLSFVPARRGPQRVSVTARVANGPAASADAAIDVGDRPWNVLFFDRRPAWTATFVRRALESDARFAVETRVVTSTGVATTTGQPPGALGDLAAIERYDAIVVGAPEALTPADAAGLEAFARRRGGAVVVFLERADLGALAALTSVRRWNELRAPEAFPVRATLPDIGEMQASEAVSPEQLPTAAAVLAQRNGSPVIFDAPLGAGRLVVGGLVDGWRYRSAPESSAFDRFWRLAIARASDAAPKAVDVRIDRTIAAPGDTLAVNVTLRSTALAVPGTTPPAADVRATLTGPSGSTVVRLWPADAPGQFRGTLRAPLTPGTYQLAASSGNSTGDASFLVAANAQPPRPDQSALLADWAASRGGSVIAADRIAELDQKLAVIIQPVRSPSPIRPMRSAWWIVAFTAVLGAEWGYRRRKQLP